MIETKIYRVEEVAEILKCSPRHIYEQIKLKKLHAIRIGHAVRVSESSLESYINNGGCA